MGKILKIAGGKYIETAGRIIDHAYEGSITHNSAEDIKIISGTKITFGDYEPIEPKLLKSLEFKLRVKLVGEKTFVPLGIPSFDRKKENKKIAFEVEVIKSSVDAIKMEILHNGKVIRSHLFKGKYSVGKHKFRWRGFDDNGIYDSTIFTTGKLRAKVTGYLDRKINSRTTDEFSFEYKEVNWVDVKIDENTKRIDVTLRVNLRDGGTTGIDCYEKDIDPDPKIRVPVKICPWEKIPKKVLKHYGKTPIKTRTKSFEELEQLALEGINYHWGRNRNHFIAKNVDINGELYEVFVNAVNTTKNAMDDIDLLYNTNTFWGRSNNPGCISGFKSFIANLAQYIPYVPLNETIFYNVGYVNNVYKAEAHFLFKNDWFYIEGTSLYKDGISKLDKEFGYTSAHEIGHNILRAYSEGDGGSADYSYKHKGSSGYSDTKPTSEGGFDYPIEGEIDLMKYYNKTPYFLDYDFDRIIAEDKDVLGLIWLTKMEIK